MSRNDRPIALVIGGTGGIGQALVTRLARDHVYSVHATYRSKPPEINNDDVQWHSLDAIHETSVQTLASVFQRVDLLINTVGALATDDYRPEKSIRAAGEAQFLSQLQINALPLLFIGKHFTTAMKQAPKARMVALSARVGSITDNQLGGWYSYRASKAALNMLVRTLAIEWQRTVPNSCLIAYHPGTVITDLSAPFIASSQTESTEDAKSRGLLTPEQASHQLLTLIPRLEASDSGSFWDWRHEVVPW